MERLVMGDIVVARYPFSDLSSSKRRPAVVVAALECLDPIVCPITSSSKSDGYSIAIGNDDLDKGSLKYESVVRSTSVFTLERSLIGYRIGHLREPKIKEIEKKLVEIFTS